jgi:hypothetical protein
MAITASASFTLNARETSTEGDRDLQDKTSIVETFTFLNASGALGVTKKFSDNRTLNTTTENLDLSGALASGLGTTTVFTKVRLLFVRWNGASGTLTVSGAGSLGAAAVLGAEVLGAGGCLLKVDGTATGLAVTAATADLIAVTSTAAGTYDVEVWGE